jgi:heme b synthase
MIGRPGHFCTDAGTGTGDSQAGATIYTPRLIAWEVTRRCMLNCRHCRASASQAGCDNELSTDECRKLLDNIASFAKPIIILTGGEPMLREDIYEIATYAKTLQLPVVMAPCGLLLNDDTVGKIIAAGIHRISVSLDGATAATHDSFRGQAGAFDACLAGIAAARRNGLGFQINTTVSRHNIQELPAILDLSIKLGAKVFNPFLLVPVGRGRQMIDQELSADQYEQTLHWLAGQQDRSDIQIRVTCAPHYQRILRQHHQADSKVAAGQSGRPVQAGCMGGKGFAFVSHVGVVQICGFLDTPCGDVRQANYDLRKIWETSEVFRQVRDVDSYQGRCGRCEFRNACGGCRARAYAMTGNYLAEEPFCTYQPKRLPISQACKTSNESSQPDDLDDADKKLLAAIQIGFPIVPSPFDALDAQLFPNISPPGESLRRTLRLCHAGIIRRIGAIFDPAHLGYVSTLVAGKVPPDRLDIVANCVSASSSVTHNYGRSHAYNLWFTLTCQSQAHLDATLDDLRRQTGIDFVSLPAVKMYKASAIFQFDSADNGENKNGQPAIPPARPADLPIGEKSGQAGNLTTSQIDLIRVLQGNIAPSSDMFDRIAAQASMGRQAVLEQIASWVSAGIVRRFAAVLAHRQAGFVANGMAVFCIDENRIDEIGAKLSQYANISHCYHRHAGGSSDWAYNLFAMVHGRGFEEVASFVQQLAAECNLGRHEILFSTHQYKKISMQYFVP